MTTTDRRAAVDRLADAKAGDGLLVIGTTPFIGEGFDAPALDTLFLAGPISYDGLLVQCAGRVIRAAPGKDIAEVHDYHDPATPDPRRLTANAACPDTAHSASPRHSGSWSRPTTEGDDRQGIRTLCPCASRIDGRCLLRSRS